MRNKYPLAPASSRARPLSPPGYRLTSGSRAALRVLPDWLAGAFSSASPVDRPRHRGRVTLNGSAGGAPFTSSGVVPGVESMRT